MKYNNLCDLPLFLTFAKCALALQQVDLHTPKPNILFVLVDDLGWAEVGYHSADDRITTPRIDALAADGVKLERHYAHSVCTPSRSAIQSGRAPQHIHHHLTLPENPDNGLPEKNGMNGIPVGMTGIAQVLQGAGYSTHMVGKWDCGYASVKQMPHSKGYQSTLTYFNHENDYWSFEVEGCKGANGVNHRIFDLWQMDENDPAPGRPADDTVMAARNNHCGDNKQAGCTYEDELFEMRVTDIIAKHDSKSPFFIFWATHVAHGPPQVPDEYLDASITPPARRMMSAMTAFVDDSIGRVIDKLKKHDFYENTLIVFTTDNGGPHSANNFPLKGGKFSPWEGGIRTVAFVSGGFVPAHRRGTTSDGLVAAWDWYATFAGLAGVDPTDKAAAADNLPPIDSVDVWPLVTGEVVKSPRRYVEIDSNEHHGLGLGGLIEGSYKIVVGDADYTGQQIVKSVYWTGPKFPNASTGDNGHDTKALYHNKQTCGSTYKTGCLYNILEDPSEHNNIASEKPYIFENMIKLLQHLKADSPIPPPVQLELGLEYFKTEPCAVAVDKYGGYLGPYMK